MKFGDATVEIALAQHSTIQPGLIDIYASLYQNDSPPYSDEEKTACPRAVARHVRPEGDHRGHARLRVGLAVGLQGRAHRQRGPDHARRACARRKARPGRCRHRRLSGARGRRHADRLYMALHRIVQAEAFPAGAPRCGPARLGRSWARAAVRPDPRDMPNTAFLAPLYRSPICIAAAGPTRARSCRSNPRAG